MKNIVRNFLLERGYKEHPKAASHKYAETLYQWRLRTPKGDQFINIWQYDMSHAYDMSHVDNNQRPLSFEVEMTFETELGPWFTGKYYGLDTNQLLDKLASLEVHLLAVHTELRGKFQE